MVKKLCENQVSRFPWETRTVHKEKRGEKITTDNSNKKKQKTKN